MNKSGFMVDAAISSLSMGGAILLLIVFVGMSLGTPNWAIASEYLMQFVALCSLLVMLIFGVILILFSRWIVAYIIISGCGGLLMAIMTVRFWGSIWEGYVITSAFLILLSFEATKKNELGSISF